MGSAIVITHPAVGKTERPNFSCVQMPDITIWFSYNTPIAFNAGNHLVVRENDWGPTTGRHLNYVEDSRWNDNQRNRKPNEVFEEMLEKALIKHPQAMDPADLLAITEMKDMLKEMDK